MNPPRFARLHATIAMVVLLAGTAPGWSQEKAAPARAVDAARNESPDTIEEARRQLQRLGLEREASLAPPGGAPRLTAPEWHGGATPAVPAPAPRPDAARATRNPNWLVEAVQKPGGEFGGETKRTGRGASGPTGLPSLSSERSQGRGEGTVETRAQVERSGDTARPPASASTVINPLASFLHDWMSPQDLALLKPGFAGNPTGQFVPPAAATPFGVGITGMPAPGPFSGTATPVPGLGAPGGLGGGWENSFLQALNPPAVGEVPGPAPFPRAAVSGAGTLPTPAPTALPPPPAPPPRVPEIVRPGLDDRYFKSLKRF